MSDKGSKVEVVLREGILDDLDFTKKLRKALDEFWCWYNAKYNMHADIDMELVKGKSDYTYRITLTIKQNADAHIVEDIANKLKEVFKKYGLYG